MNESSHAINREQPEHHSKSIEMCINEKMNIFAERDFSRVRKSFSSFALSVVCGNSSVENEKRKAHKILFL